ncbi:MAG: zeta toxin family protein, partial [Myxococcota bacterium]
MKPFVVGIAGGTGSGKSTIAAKIREGIPDGACATLDHDSYYKEHPDLRLEERELLNYDHPDALDNDLLVAHLDALRGGKAVNVPIYDFVTHARKTETRLVEPRPIVVVEGILTFVDERLRERL